jgi:hypothetical protein
VKPGLSHLQHIAAVVTYGRPRWKAWVMGDPPRKFVKRYLRALCGARARIDYHACYYMNTATRSRLHDFIRRVNRAMRRF